MLSVSDGDTESTFLRGTTGPSVIAEPDHNYLLVSMAVLGCSFVCYVVRGTADLDRPWRKTRPISHFRRTIQILNE